MTRNQLVFKTTVTVLVVAVFCFLPVVLFWKFSCRDSPLSKKPAGKMGPCGPLAFTRLRLPVTGLASFPGSGNTLLRSLIQESTGILTGSEYLDQELATSGFHGEGATVHHNGSHVILIKTHGSDAGTRERYDRLILLVRHPKGAILSDFNRVYGGGHLGRATGDQFKYWPEFFQLHLTAWGSFHRDWLTFNKSTLVVFYDDLISDPVVHLRKALNFLRVNVSESRLACAIDQSLRYRRSRSRRQTQLYSPADQQKLDGVYKNITQEISQRFCFSGSL
ncbi:unnamed protein product [Lymnaea stagnalis]|uniref:Sulfotransferase domain-containing protein n=1 Tax=Lymnaea stagnalis TaxID=6523 RepID=A0AAV2HT77_LYMST